MTPMQGFRKVAFLDTNALHAIGLYLEYARKRSLFPWNKGTSNDAEAALHRSRRQKAEKDALLKGFYILSVASSNSLDLQCSALTQLELTSARVRGKAITHAAREGLPDRIWSRVRERDIRDRVGADQMARIAGGVRDIEQTLEGFDFAEATTTRREAARAVEVAAQILGLVYMEPMDSLVYASALLSGADMLLTTDGPFCETVNEIARPGSTAGGTKRDRFRRVKTEVKNLVKAVYGPSSEFELLSAHRVTESGAWKPALK